ncbi:hypothetical protein CCR75_006370 [Bremia lactucae]|uniref:Uncharacterized protein n=1 Tax=Bremia lactucae TaxID=4779 RepID=A0A976IFS7_BRELC|nr:hypothetical protein CCR75_006370 [Bremia lactucae]
MDSNTTLSPSVQSLEATAIGYPITPRDNTEERSLFAEILISFLKHYDHSVNWKLLDEAFIKTATLDKVAERIGLKKLCLALQDAIQSGDKIRRKHALILRLELYTLWKAQGLRGEDLFLKLELDKIIYNITKTQQYLIWHEYMNMLSHENVLKAEFDIITSIFKDGNSWASLFGFSEHTSNPLVAYFLKATLDFCVLQETPADDVLKLLKVSRNDQELFSDPLLPIWTTYLQKSSGSASSQVYKKAMDILSKSRSVGTLMKLLHMAGIDKPENARYLDGLMLFLIDQGVRPVALLVGLLSEDFVAVKPYDLSIMKVLTTPILFLWTQYAHMYYGADKAEVAVVQILLKSISTEELKQAVKIALRDIPNGTPNKEGLVKMEKLLTEDAKSLVDTSLEKLDGMDTKAEHLPEMKTLAVRFCLRSKKWPQEALRMMTLDGTKEPIRNLTDSLSKYRQKREGLHTILRFAMEAEDIITRDIVWHIKQVLFRRYIGYSKTRTYDFLIGNEMDNILDAPNFAFWHEFVMWRDDLSLDGIIKAEVSFIREKYSDDVLVKKFGFIEMAKMTTDSSKRFQSYANAVVEVLGKKKFLQQILELLELNEDGMDLFTNSVFEKLDVYLRALNINIDVFAEIYSVGALFKMLSAENPPELCRKQYMTDLVEWLKRYHASTAAVLATLLIDEPFTVSQLTSALERTEQMLNSENDKKFVKSLQVALAQKNKDTSKRPIVLDLSDAPAAASNRRRKMNPTLRIAP